MANYLSVEVASIKRLFAFDYSRALFYRWPFASFPLERHSFQPPTPSQTLRCGRVLRALHGFDLQSALHIVQRLDDIDVTIVTGILAEMPSDWLPDPRRSDFIDWWGNGSRSTHLNALRQGLNNGSLL